MSAPWVFAVLAAIWFGYLGLKADGHWLRWMVAGSLYALSASTMVLGLCDAARIPLSHEVEVRFQTNSLILASLPILLVGGSVVLFLWCKGRLGGENKTVP